jgi:hypothetical protein
MQEQPRGCSLDIHYTDWWDKQASQHKGIRKYRNSKAASLGWEWRSCQRVLCWRTQDIGVTESRLAIHDDAFKEGNDVLGCPLLPAPTEVLYNNMKTSGSCSLMWHGGKVLGLSSILSLHYKWTGVLESRSTQIVRSTWYLLLPFGVWSTEIILCCLGLSLARGS